MIDKCPQFFLSQNFVPQISAQIGGYAMHDMDLSMHDMDLSMRDTPDLYMRDMDLSMRDTPDLSMRETGFCP